MTSFVNAPLLKFNPTKCKILHVNINKNPCLGYKIDGFDLNTCENDQENDLGVITSVSMLWIFSIGGCPTEV